MAILSILTGAAIALAAVLVYRLNESVYEATGMDGKTVLITGGTTGLGLESAKRLAKAGAKVIVTARNDEKGQSAVQIINEFSNGKAPDASFKILQLDDLESTKAAAQWDLPPIDVLMLNAGIMGLPHRQMTELGVEKQFHTNHLGHFVFTKSVEPFLTRNARIIVVASLGHKIGIATGGLDFDYVWKPTEKTYNPLKSYGMSKLANIYFAAKLDSISSYTAVSLHPGCVATDLVRQVTNIKALQTFIDRTIMPLGKSVGITLSPEQGANTQVYLASTTDPIVGGGYYSGTKPQKLGSFAADPAQANKLWKQSEEISGVRFAF